MLPGKELIYIYFLGHCMPLSILELHLHSLGVLGICPLQKASNDMDDKAHVSVTQTRNTRKDGKEKRAPISIKTKKLANTRLDGYLDPTYLPLPHCHVLPSA